MGLHRAGYDVIGVDIKPQPHYPFTFVQGDALVPPIELSRIDFIWASPPCQKYSPLRHVNKGRKYYDLIPQTRELLIGSGLPYVIENVPGAPVRYSLMLCGTMFGLQTKCGAELRRHRLFETSFPIMGPQCQHGQARRGAPTITITGNTPQQNVVRNKVRRTFTVNDARDAMGIDWMPMVGLSQAIPPAYSEFIGRAALAHIQQ